MCQMLLNQVPGDITAVAVCTALLARFSAVTLAAIIDIIFFKYKV